MFNTDKQAEQKFLAKTLSIIQSNIQKYQGEVTRMQGELDEMLEHYHDADDELWTLINNTITLNEHMKKALFRNERALNKPYFGRLIFHDLELDRDESLYIGKGGISVDSVTQQVIDWRAPVANAYYENGLGDITYTAPEGKQYHIDLKLKRTFEIDNGELKDFFDSEIVSNDDLLTKYLSRNKEAVLGEIVATIQKEQNEIIRKTPFHNIIVQGVAGSGKTTVAMHRISYILYNYQERFKPDDFYIVGSNQILLNYITGVLPDLDVYGVRQMTMEQLMIRLLYEEWVPGKYDIKTVLEEGDVIKGTAKWYHDLKDFIARLEDSIISKETVKFNPRQYVEGLQDGKGGVYDRRAEDAANNIPERFVTLVRKEDVERYLAQNENFSIQSKILMLNERLISRLKEEFLNNGIKYSESERKAIMKAYRSFYGPKEWKTSIYKIYKEFLTEQCEKGYSIKIPSKALDVYDLAALALIYKFVKETEVISEAHHIVIDEAQDFGMMIYHVLHDCIKDTTYTIMGDTSQNIHFGFGLGDWSELRKLLLSNPSDSFNTLRKSYRNTIEISEFATNILRHGTFPIYPVEPIIRHGKQVEITTVEQDTIAEKSAEICKNWQAEGYTTIAVVCRNEEESKAFASSISKYIDILECDPETANFANGIMVLPVGLTKGLEFDAVLIVDPTKEKYPLDNGHAKLLYVAATRALHELNIVSAGNLTSLVDNTSINDTKQQVFDNEDTSSTKTVKRQISIVRPTVTPRKKPVIISNSSAKQSEDISTAKPAIPTSKHQSSSDASIVIEQSSQEVPKESVQKDAKSFGDMPETSLLRPAGHARITQSIKWVSKERDGIYLQSPYGILRITPVNTAIVRITFAKGSKMIDTTLPEIKVDRIEKNYRFKETLKNVEIGLPEVTVSIDKVSGAMQFLDAAGQILLAEKTPESRFIEQNKGWWFISPTKKEQIFAVNTGKDPIMVKGSTRYITDGEPSSKVPFLLSSKGYGILPASMKPVIFCDVPAYGTYISEQESQLDFYFVAGKQQNNIAQAYKYLCGIL